MNFAQGIFLWDAGAAVGHLYEITGLGFQPKALRFRTLGHQEGATIATESTFGRRSLGVAVGPSARRCVAACDQDGSKNMVCTSGYRDDCVVMTLVNEFGALASGRLDLDALLPDGFRCIVDATPQQVNIGVMWEAWGGPEVTAAEVVDFAEPAAPGAVDYLAVPAFQAGALDQVLLLAGVQQTILAEGRADSGFFIGYATAPDPVQQAVACGNNHDTARVGLTSGYARAGECLAMIAIGGGNPNARATLAAWLDGGFRLNWLARGTTGRRSIALALKGGSWRAGAYAIDGTQLGALAVVTGLGFSPTAGLCFLGRMAAEHLPGVGAAQDRLSLGCAVDPTQRQASGYLSENGTANSEVDIIHEEDAVLGYPSTFLDGQPSFLSAYDLQSVDPDGFTIRTTRAGGVVSEWQGYLVFA